MATKTKPQGPRFKKFEIWTKMAKVPKPQGPKWQFTQTYNIKFYLKFIVKSINTVITFIICLKSIILPSSK
ncbi:hypothetical protein Hanom_Chr16g01450851 [Helianthus anomalus]